MFFGRITLKDIDVKERSVNICLTAVKKNPLDLEYVPDEICNEEMCMIAVKEDAKSLKFVPYRYKDYKICLVAIVESKIKYVHILTYVNDDNMTHAAARMTEKEYNDLVFKAVNYDGRALKDVPDNLKTSELCNLAVRYDGIALQYVPINLRTLEICEQAVINSSKAIKYVNDEQMKEYLSIKYEITQDKINNENNENIKRLSLSYYGAPTLSRNIKQYYGKR